MKSMVGPGDRILVIRMGAMGDIIHTLPAVATLKKSFPDAHIGWLVAPRWMPLLKGNPSVEELISFDRSNIDSLIRSWKCARAFKPDVAFDFQGLLQSALLGRAVKPQSLFGFDKSVAREPLAASLYTHRIPVVGPHRVERNVQMAGFAGAGNITHQAWIPRGFPEGILPPGRFVLASPFAGWTGKEWPLESYDRLGEILKGESLPLVLNVPESRAGEISGLKHVQTHTSSLSGLIDATRRAEAVIGLDSGPIHLAAALGKPGVALYGPTDPMCTGPFGGSFEVLRTHNAETTYKRRDRIDASMRMISAELVAEGLLHSLARRQSAALVERS